MKKILIFLILKVLTKYNPKTIISEEHVMLLNIKNFEHAI